MKRFVKTVPLILLATVLAEPARSGFATTVIIKDIKAELQYTLGGDNINEDFYRPQDFAVDKGGNVYVLDSGNSRIQCFSKEGKFVRSFGRGGNGPGELSAYANSLKFLEDGRLYVIDNYQRRISVFNTTGEFLESFKTNASYDDIYLCKGTFYLSNFVLSEKHRPIKIMSQLNGRGLEVGKIYEPCINLIDKIKHSPIPLENSFSESKMTSVRVSPKGSLIYSQRNPYQIAKYSLAGDMLKETEGEVGFSTHIPLEISFENNGVKKKLLGPTAVIPNILLQRDGRLIVPIFSSDHKHLILDVYDENLGLVGRYRTQVEFYAEDRRLFIAAVHLDSEGYLCYLYYSQEDSPHLKKYRLDLSKPNLITETPYFYLPPIGRFYPAG